MFYGLKSKDGTELTNLITNADFTVLNDLNLSSKNKDAFNLKEGYQIPCPNNDLTYEDLTDPNFSDEDTIYYLNLPCTKNFNKFTDFDTQKPMTLVFNIKTRDTTVALPFDGTDLEYSVWWGDGNVDEGITLKNKSHKYVLPGRYTVHITGKFQKINSDQTPTVNGIEGWKESLVSVVSLGNINGLVNFFNAFKGCKNLSYFHVGEYNGTPTGSLADMFNGAESLQDVNLDGFVTENIENLEGMFNGANHLKVLSINDWDTSKVANFSNMFKDNYSLEYLDLSHFNVSESNDFESMFENAKYLYSLTLSYWDIDLATDEVTNIFKGLANIQYFNVRGWPQVSGTGDGSLPDLGISITCGSDEETCLDDAIISCSTISDGDDFTFKWGGQNCDGGTPMAFQVTIAEATEEDRKKVILPLYCGWIGSGEKCEYKFQYCYTSDDEDKQYDCQESGEFELTRDQNYYGKGNENKIEIEFTTPGEKIFIIDGKIEGWGYDLASANHCGDADNDDYGAGNFRDILTKFNFGDIKFKSLRYAFCGTSLNQDDIVDDIIDTSELIELSFGFKRMPNVTELNLNHWDTSKLKKLNGTFQFRGSDIETALTSLSINKWNVSSITEMNGTFRGLKKLTTLDLSNWTTGFISTNQFDNTFRELEKITSLDLSGFKIDNVRKFDHTFANTLKLETLNLSNWVFSPEEYIMHYMFYKMGSSLTAGQYTKITMDKMPAIKPKIDTEGDNDFGVGIFTLAKIESLDLSAWDVSELDKLYYLDRDSYNGMFDDSKFNTLNLSNWELKNGADLTEMFENAEIENLILSNWNTAGVTKMDSMFQNAKIPILDLSHFDMTKVTSAKNMFHGITVSGLLDLHGWDLLLIDLGTIEDEDYAVKGMFNSRGINYLTVSGWTKKYYFRRTNSRILAYRH